MLVRYLSFQLPVNTPKGQGLELETESQLISQLQPPVTAGAKGAVSWEKRPTQAAPVAQNMAQVPAIPGMEST